MPRTLHSHIGKVTDQCLQSEHAKNVKRKKKGTTTLENFEVREN